MKRSVPNYFNYAILLVLLSGFGLQSFSQTVIPELVFHNPVLVSGKALSEGAVYRFSNVATGIDATITMTKWSSKSIVMNSFDNSSMGWDKAFQPEFGLPGTVPANSNWYIDFRVDFYKAGLPDTLNVDKFSVTALDVDGDGYSVAEYVQMFGATTVSYSNSTLLKQPTIVAVCPICSKISPGSIACTTCLGLGYTLNGGGKKKTCKTCNGIGYIFSVCGHPFTGATYIAQASIDNAANIDTSKVANMATYQFNNVQSFSFRYGATSQNAVNGSGIRLNSMWFKAFNLTPPTSSISLPVRLLSFDAHSEASGSVNLVWKTAEEQDLSHFVVERSTDGVAFKDIAVVFSAGGASGMQYSYRDKNVSTPSGSLFYRIRFVDQSTEASYSPTRMLKFGQAVNALALSGYPNPVDNELQLTLPAQWEGKPVNVNIYNANGNIMLSFLKGNAAHTETLQLSTLPRGFYIVKASSGNEETQQRIIKN